MKAIDVEEFAQICFDIEKDQKGQGNYANALFISELRKMISTFPTIDAAPLDKLCEWLSENSVNFPCTSCKNVLNDCCYCTADWDEGVPCPNSTDDWRRAITEWMEEQDVADRRE